MSKRGLPNCRSGLLFAGLLAVACSNGEAPAPGNGSTSVTGGNKADANGAAGGGQGGRTATGGTSPVQGGGGSGGGAGAGGTGGGTPTGGFPDGGGTGLGGSGGSMGDAATDLKGSDAESAAPDAKTGPFALTSAVVKAGQVIATKYRCGPENVSPPLSWPAGPTGTMSYAVTMLHTNSVHWVLWDIPANVTDLPEGIAREAEPPVPAGAKQAKPNLDGSTWFGYTGPCPHGAAQSYEYNVYALSVAKLAGPTTGSMAPEVNAAILKSKPLATAQLSVMASK